MIKMDYQILSWIKTLSVLLIFVVFTNSNVISAGVEDLSKMKGKGNNSGDAGVLHPAGYSGYCTNAYCSIVCKNGESKYLPGDIAATGNISECLLMPVSLTIFNYSFVNNEIGVEWKPTSLYISELRIVQSNVVLIQPNAFENGSFSNISTLVLEDLSLSFLTSGVFNGLSQLKELIISQDLTAISSIDNDILIPMQYKICTLKIRAGLTTPQNITRGQALLNALTNVDLSHNHFFDTIGRMTFFKLSVVESLDLSYAEISYLPPDVLHGIATTIRVLDLSNNLLVTLPPFIFQPLLSSPKVTVNLVNNNWNCTCALQKVVKDLVNPSLATCSDPRELLGVQIVEVDLCGPKPDEPEPVPNHSDEVYHAGSGSLECDGSPGTSSLNSGNNLDCDESAADSNTNGNTMLPPQQPSQVIKLLCQICESPDCSGNRSSYIERLQIRGREEDISVTILTRTSVQVTVTDTDGNGYGLLWFSNATKLYYQMEINYKEYGLGCYGNMMKPVVIDGLIPNTTYTFCIVRRGEELTSPFNCVSHHVRSFAVRSEGVWLTNDSKLSVISLLLCGILFAMVLGGSLVYCVVMRKPTLLKGNKRVVVVKKNATDVMVLPRTESMIREINRMETFSMKKKKPSLHRQKSSTSLDSNISYVSPNLYEIIPADKAKEAEQASRYHLSNPIVPKRLSSDPLPLTPLDLNIGNICHNCQYIENNLPNYL